MGMADPLGLEDNQFHDTIGEFLSTFAVANF